MPHIAVDVDTLFLRESRRRAEAHVVVVVSADDEHAPIPPGDFFDLFVKQIFRLGGGQIGIEHVARDEDEFRPFLLADFGDLVENGCLLFEAVAPVEPLSDMPIRCV